MKNITTYRKLKIPIDNVLEIRLSPLSWNKIKWVAVNKNRTYSWVVRYAIFRMIKRSGQFHPDGENVGLRSAKIAKLNDLMRSERGNSQKKHRHRLCLYGKDELFIRIAAAKMGCTMSHLIRLSLTMYLDDLVSKFPYIGRSRDRNGRFSGPAWKCLGIKIYRGVRFHTIGARQQHFEFTYYQKSDYW
ncbi:MAG: hypothetical protein ABUK01_04620 [Leptospirales bacterium]